MSASQQHCQCPYANFEESFIKTVTFLVLSWLFTFTSCFKEKHHYQQQTNKQSPKCRSRPKSIDVLVASIWGQKACNEDEMRWEPEMSETRRKHRHRRNDEIYHYIQGVSKKRSFVIPAPLEAVGWSKGLDIINSQKHFQTSFFWWDIPFWNGIVWRSSLWLLPAWELRHSPPKSVNNLYHG